MPRYETRWWEGDPSLGTHHPRARGYSYQAYVPDLIENFDLTLSLDLTRELEATAQAVTQLQDLVSASGLEALSRQLLRAESIGSSRIEGLQLSQRKLARADLDPAAASDLARFVMGNIAAMDAAIAIGSRPAPIDTLAILEIHRTLLGQTRDAHIAGHLRTSQNWIGGSSHGPARATFVPPPEGMVPDLLDDMCAFLSRTNVPAIIQAAIAHAQFETIHPFADGNGRVGRALIHAVLRRRHLTPRFVPPVSLVLASNAERYIDGLTAFRAEDPTVWCQTFIRTLYSSTEHAKRFHGQLLDLQDAWRIAANQPRADSAAERIIRLLPANPVLNADSARALLDCSDVSARNALNELAAAGVLRQVSIGRRNRVWEATELLNLVDDFEWHLREAPP